MANLAFRDLTFPRLGRRSGPSGPSVGVPSISGLTDLGDDLFVAQIGTLLTAADGVPAGPGTYEWKRNGTTIATTATYTPIAADDEQFLSLQPTGYPGSRTAEYLAIYAPPTASGAGIPAQSFTIASGVQTFATTGGFTAGAGTFTILPATTGVSINPTTGLVSVDTGVTGPLSSFGLTVYKENSGGTVGVAVSLTVAASAMNSVVDMVAANDDYFENIISGFNGGVLVDGIFFGWVYYDGNPANWDDGAVIVSVADHTVGTTYAGLRTGAATQRLSGNQNTPGLGTPAVAGWYFCSCHLTTTTTNFRRNGVSATPAGGEAVNTIAANATRYSMGRFGDSTPSNYLDQLVCGVGFATGTLAQMIAFNDWVHSNGADPATYNFAGAGMTAKHFRPLAKIGGSGAVLATDAALDDTIGGMADPTIGVAPQWAAVAPPWASSGVPVSTTTAEVPVGATNTIVLTATLPSGSWGPTRTVDITRLQSWSEKGPDYVPTITGYSTSAVGAVCTVTLTLDRTIYIGEPIRIEGTANWITDNLGNYSTPLLKRSATNNSAAAFPALWPGVSLGKTAVKFSTAVAGQFYNIRGFTFDTARVAACTITDEWPARTTMLYLGVSRRIHGAMKNPERVTTESPFFYSESLPLRGTALPITLASGDTYTKVRSSMSPDTLGGGRSGHGVANEAYMALDCSSAAIAANEWPMQLILASGQPRQSSMVWDEATLTMPAPLSAPAGMVWSEISAHRMKLNPTSAMLKGTEARRSQGPAWWTMADAYGDDVAGIQGNLYAAIVSDITSESNRRDALVWEIYHGWQSYYPIKQAKAAGGIDFVEPDGGTAQGLVLPVAIMLAATGQNTNLGNLKTEFGGNEVIQAFRFDAGKVAKLYNPQAVGDTSAPRISREIEVLSVSGNTITYVTATAPAFDNVNYVGLSIVRATDDSLVGVVSSQTVTPSQPASATVASISGSVSPGDKHYAIPYWTITAGDVDWGIYGWDATATNYTPAAAAPYRYNNHFGGGVILQRMGWMHSSWDALWDYIVGAETANYPTAGGNWASPFLAYEGDNFARDFFTTHLAALQATPQTVG